jgi:hypothetical protein
LTVGCKQGSQRAAKKSGFQVAQTSQRRGSENSGHRAANGPHMALNAFFIRIE